MKKNYLRIPLPVKCPACKINLAVISPVLGVIHCEDCQNKDIKRFKSPEFYSLNKMHRVQGQRDRHSRDILQPFNGDKMNPDFAKAYTKLAPKYYNKEELKSL